MKVTLDGVIRLEEAFPGLCADMLTYCWNNELMRKQISGDG